MLANVYRDLDRPEMMCPVYENALKTNESEEVYTYVHHYLFLVFYINKTTLVILSWHFCEALITENLNRLAVNSFKR